MARDVTSGFMSRQITNEHYKATQRRKHVQAFLRPRADPTVPRFGVVAVKGTPGSFGNAEVRQSSEYIKRGTFHLKAIKIKQYSLG